MRQGRSGEAVRRPERDGKAGFSLVELLVVLAIIGMIATMVTPQVLGYLGRAKGETARIQVKNLAQAVELYYLDLGTYPTTQEGLAALVTPPEGARAAWRGPYLRDGKGLLDPWGRPFLYRSPGAGGAPFEIAFTDPDAPGRGAAPEVAAR
ncbi:general secretion pathway protein G [Methylobacterium sp. 4-46]|uniref:type II secretion system major pseudopilin GspG n=1 Tax=unclassified Methylobacterium TaxID=2615210 RepID=UPI000152DF61|nr:MULTISPECIES: type II secretion system major pseudopilin GspG [Methylobacterium]ACA16107.1 general secretion pathway protein G [Methylobacterium sp. 4-46]WFT81818.1 type II secretion system major pseudopilin GspG [Methylobacterium nodulans]